MFRFENMKALIVIGSILLFACAQAHAERIKIFSKDVEDEAYRYRGNPSSMGSIVIKINAVFSITQQYRIDQQIYQSIYNIFGNIRKMKYPNVFGQIANDQDRLDNYFDELNKERDEGELRSEVNYLLDNVVNNYTEKAADVFHITSTQAKHLEEQQNKIADELHTLIDDFCKSVEKCLDIPRTEFKEIVKCRQNTRRIFPPLLHNAEKLEGIANELSQLENLEANGVDSIFADIDEARETLLLQIRDLKNKRQRKAN